MLRGGPNTYSDFEIYAEGGDDEVYVKESVDSVRGGSGADKIYLGSVYKVEGSSGDDMVRFV